VRSVFLAACWIAGCFALIYLPDCGLGFLKDDFGWIESSRLNGWGAVWRAFQSAPTGFYRPLVSLSFGVNTLLFGLHPLPYGLTNLALATMAAMAVWWLIVRLGFSPGLGLAAASIWMLNFHGIGLAILWTSGRTSLLASLFAACAACAFASARPILCGILTLGALFSKEEPLLLPLVFGAWFAIDRLAVGDVPHVDSTRPAPPRGTFSHRSLMSVATSTIAAAVYLVIRSRTDAMTLWTAPDYYQYRLAVIPLNGLHYSDRSLTLTVSLLILGMLFVQRKQLSLSRLERSTIFKGVVWLLGGFALTIMIPVRSSLYVCLPSIGSALIFVGAASAEWRAISRRRLVLAVLLILPLAFVPVYWARDLELREEELMTTNALRAMTAQLAGRHVGRLIVYDNLAERPALGDAFGDALPIALRLFAPNDAPSDVSVSRDPIPPALAGSDTLELVLSGATLVERSTH
jgi:hypothetical protein